MHPKTQNIPGSTLRPNTYLHRTAHDLICWGSFYPLEVLTLVESSCLLISQSKIESEPKVPEIKPMIIDKLTCISA